MPGTRPAPLRSRRRGPLRLIAGLGAFACCVALALAAPGLERVREFALGRFGADAAAAVLAWQRMLDEAAGAGELEQLGRVNSFFNRRLRFEDDIVVWRQSDYWASPLETLARGAGDCEDFAIAKYVSLRLLGIPDERLRLIYVRARSGGAGSTLSQAHMVVGFYPAQDEEPLVLDNLVGEIRPASRRPDLFPIFSFTAEGLWVAGARSSSADPSARLSRWRSVLERMQQEGLQLGP